MRYTVVIVIIVVLGIGGFLAYSMVDRGAEKEKTTTPAANELETDPNSATGITKVVEYTDNGFRPSKVIIAIGDTIRFTNVGSDGMWVASDNHPTHDLLPEFDQGGVGQSYSFTFTEAGSWGFHNHLNASETGFIEVLAEAGD